MVVRRPFIFSYEYPEEMRDESGELKQASKYDGTVHVYKERWKVLEDAFVELEDQALDAQVEWGSQFQDAIIPLRQCRGELLIAVQDLLSSRKNPHEHRGVSREERQEHRSVLYYVGENSEHDKFTPQINAAIEVFEKKLRPHIKK